MPSPIAHAVSGHAITKLWDPKLSGKRYTNRILLILYSVFISIAADFDFLPQLLVSGADFHRGITHSLAFAVVFSFTMASIFSYWTKCQYRKILVITLVLYSSHLILDFFTEGGSGIPLFWPLINGPFKSSFSIFPGVHHSKGLFDLSHLTFVSFELAYSCLIMLGISLFKSLNQSINQRFISQSNEPVNCYSFLISAIVEMKNVFKS